MPVSNAEITDHAIADDAAVRLLRLTEQFAAESHPQREITVTLDSSFERDLGFDSLGRVELLLRAERAFAVSLPANRYEPSLLGLSVAQTSEPLLPPIIGRPFHQRIFPAASVSAGRVFAPLGTK